MRTSEDIMIMKRNSQDNEFKGIVSGKEMMQIVVITRR